MTGPATVSYTHLDVYKRQVVGGAFQGQRRAINSQKNNMGITNVVSADQVGRDYIRNPHVVFL